ncbi:MAG: hypothetical protein M0C28_12930 [Candidatus Moduliflexus flocculans]|nr:hypothetical protein [Candidatus Moduliflexus flocculans]
MTNPLRKMITPVLALACLAALALPLAAQTAAPAAAQDKPVDMKKLIAEIVGDYEFSAQGQILLVTFSEQDGKLFGAPPGETPEEIHPVEGKPLCFDVTLAGLRRLLRAPVRPQRQGRHRQVRHERPGHGRRGGQGHQVVSLRRSGP